MFLRLVNIGDVKSLAAHPASTTHRQLEGEELESAGVTPDMIRLCVGIEDIEDILADLEQDTQDKPQIGRMMYVQSLLRKR